MLLMDELLMLTATVKMMRASIEHLAAMK